MTRASNPYGEYKKNEGVGVIANKRSEYSIRKWKRHRRENTKDAIIYDYLNPARSRHNDYPYVRTIYNSPFRSKQLTSSRWNRFKHVVTNEISDKIRKVF